MRLNAQQTIRQHQCFLLLVVILLVVGMALVGCASAGRSGTSQSSVTTVGTFEDWKLAPDPCMLFGSRDALILGNGTAPLTGPKESHEGGLGERLCIWSGDDLSVVVGITTNRSTIPHFRLETDLSEAEAFNLDLPGSQGVWKTNPGGKSSIVEGVYDGVKVRLVIGGSLTSSQKSTIIKMFSAAIKRAANDCNCKEFYEMN